MSRGQYPEYCGPAVVSAALDIDRVEAANLLRECGETRPGWTEIRFIARAVGGICTHVRKKGKENLLPGRYKTNCPTVRNWIERNPNKEAILLASKHFVYVKNGKVVEDNGYCPLKGKVTHAVLMHV